MKNTVPSESIFVTIWLAPGEKEEFDADVAMAIACASDRLLPSDAAWQLAHSGNLQLDDNTGFELRRYRINPPDGRGVSMHQVEELAQEFARELGHFAWTFTVETSRPVANA